MFDVNPNPDGGAHALDIGDLFADAGFYRLSSSEAKARYAEIEKVIPRTYRAHP